MQHRYAQESFQDPHPPYVQFPHALPVSHLAQHLHSSVLILDSPAADATYRPGIVGAGAPHTLAPPAEPPRRPALVPSVEGPDEQAQDSDEHGGPGAPTEAKCVGPDLGFAAVGAEDISGLDECCGHESNGDGEEEQPRTRNQRGDGRSQASTTRHEARQERHDSEEQPHQIQYPAEPPHVEVVRAGRIPAMTTNQFRGDIGCVARPGVAERQGGIRRTAVRVALAADEEVRPLGDRPGAGDAVCRRAKEVCVREGAGGGEAGEDDEEH